MENRHLTGGTIGEYRKSTARGAKISKTKLDENKIRLIRERFTAGVDYKDIAMEFGVAKTTIQAIKYGKSWQYVD